jgi:hypothetical protein
MSLPDFRELYEQLLEYKGERAYQDVLLPWQDNAVRAMNALKHCGEIRARLLCNRGMIKHLWSLYALSRVSDILLLPFQKGDCDGSSWPGPTITAEERDAYFISLGMTPIEQETFHPFFHEIVEVTQSDDADEPITLDGVIWSGFMLGSMLFCRAGVRVRGGRRHIKKEIAEKSTLYFTFRRKNRPHQDASHRWGGNSPWRTCFRRDYEGDARYYYNVGGASDTASPDTWRSGSEVAESPEERIEMLVNRCFILSAEPVEELDPYSEKYTEWKMPVWFTHQCREDKIEESRQNKLSNRISLLLYYPLLFVAIVVVVTAMIVEKIRKGRDFLLLFVGFVIFVCFAFSLQAC